MTMWASSVLVLNILLAYAQLVTLGNARPISALGNHTEVRINVAFTAARM